MCTYTAGTLTCSWVDKGEARFGVSKLVEVVEPHYVWGLKMALWVLVPLPTASHFIIQLRRGQGCQKRGVGAGNTHSIFCTTNKQNI